MARKSDWDFSVSGLSEAPWKNYVTRPTASGGTYTVPLAESPQMEMERPPALNVLRPVADAATSVMGTPVAPSAPVGPQINVVPPMQPAPSAPATPFQQALADERAWNDRARANAIRAGIRVSNMTPEEEQTALEETQRRTYDTRQQEAIGARLATLRDVTTKRAQAQVEAGLQAEGFTPAEIETYSQLPPQEQRKMLAQVRTQKAVGERAQATLASRETIAREQMGIRKEIATADRDARVATSREQLDAAMDRLLVGAKVELTKQDRDQIFKQDQLSARYAEAARLLEKKGDINKALEFTKLQNALIREQFSGQVQSAVREYKEIPNAPTLNAPISAEARPLTAGAQTQPTSGVPSGTAMPDVTGDGKPETKAEIDGALMLISRVPKPPPDYGPDELRRWERAKLIVNTWRSIEQERLDKRYRGPQM